MGGFTERKGYKNYTFKIKDIINNNTLHLFVYRWCWWIFAKDI